MTPTPRVYIIGRIRDGKFETYQGVIRKSRSDARQYLEDELTPRLSERNGWTVFEAVDILSHISEKNGSNQ